MGAEANANGATNGQSNGTDLGIIPNGGFVPLIINGEDITLPNNEKHYQLPESHDTTTPSQTKFQAANDDLILKALEGSQEAFQSWRNVGPAQRRGLLLKVAQYIRENPEPIKAMIKEEIHCNDFWTLINYLVSISLVEETAAAVSSESMNGQIPPSIVPGAYPLVFNEPYGVVLGIAPWNAPLILGLRAILAPLAAGNATIFKGSEFSPRVHYFIANLFRKVGFPPGIVNFILHAPEDAVSTFNTLISNPIVKKANFTGSTAVGRSIAQTAGKYLKPVLLELGGKNISIVLEDADIDRAAKETLDAAMMNNGQVCMCTDTVLVQRSVSEKFASTLHSLLQTWPERDSHVIASKGRTNISNLVDDASSKGAKITKADGGRDTGNLFPLTLIENLTAEMNFNKIEAFGPLLGMRVLDTEEDILRAIHESGYGLSTSIFSRNHLKAINLGRKIDTGAVHINAGTVHDEGNFPHGGVGESGYGRFNGVWGMKEFSRTKTIMIYPD